MRFLPNFVTGHWPLQPMPIKRAALSDDSLLRATCRNSGFNKQLLTSFFRSPGWSREAVLSRHALSAVPMAAGWVSALALGIQLGPGCGNPAPEGKGKEEEKVESKEALGINPIIVVTQKIWELQGTHVNFRQGSPVHFSNAAHRHIHTLCNFLPRHPLYVF